jgi:serine/threonine protein kinase/dienelactone hydrolase
MANQCPDCHTAIVQDSNQCSNCGAFITSDGIKDALTITRPSTPENFLAGSILKEKYRILERIGSGGMGVVYKAEDLRLKRLVALKFLSSLLDGSDAHQRFVLEAQAASELDHPNICTVYELDETETGQMYIAMAYYPGESLKEKIKQGPLAIEDSLQIAIQLTEGLGNAHQHGVVHRDIKPANILITEGGTAKIVDFGLARLARTAHITKPGTTMGTLAYMSPDQIQGNEVDHRTDIWSLGVVMFEMLTGRLPFKGKEEASLVYSIVHEQPEPIRKFNPDVPPDLERIVMRTLEKKPESRYSSVLETLNDLENYKKATEARVVNLSSFSERIRKPEVILPAIIMTVGIIFLAYWYINRQSEIRWATEKALPEIERLTVNTIADYTEAYTLAEKTEEYIPDDPKLAKLFDKCSVKINITTEPPGAKIYMKQYKAPNDDWKYLGLSPLQKIRLPVSTLRWKIEKEGYETILAAAPTWDLDFENNFRLIPNSLLRVLDKKENIPTDMVRIPGLEKDNWRVGDFYIDKYEVTNKKYKEFIKHGGYKNKKYWKEKFFEDGKQLTWEEAFRRFIDETDQPGPANWQASDYQEGQADYPVSGISWYEAAAYAEFARKALPTVHHWGIARGEYTPLIQRRGAGGFALLAPFSNFFKANGPVPVGSLSGITSYGAFDMAGNVREWCWNGASKGKLLRGGAWNDQTYMFGNMSQAPPMDRSIKNGFRCALYLEPETISESVYSRVDLGETKNFYKEQPVSDPIFQVYKEQFSYDNMDLNDRVEFRKESNDWFQDKITYDAAYGGERIIAYLFLPKNAKPPYQTIIYFPGSGSVHTRSSVNLESYDEYKVFLSFLVKSGRAVLFPVYKATFERGNSELAELHEEDWSSRKYTELLIQVTKDFKRSIDYLETRWDIDLTKLAYQGMSWGGMYGAIIPAVEERIHANIMLSGGLTDDGRPEVKQINYVTRVKIPTLMLNGRYDTGFPVDSSIKPLFDLLGTSPKNKYLKLYESDHVVPRNEMIKEILSFLDHYLGPAR